jgi:uncharacterized protein (TIGR00730 family)
MAEAQDAASKTATPRRVAVFCGSNCGADPSFTAAAQDFGRLLCAQGHALVYGGGDVGLMGVIADTMMAAGGQVLGVIPRLLVEREVAHRGITELILVESMHDRKRRMYELADVMIAMPGGIGTFEEIFEALTWNQLGIHKKPCGLLNIGGYYDPLVAQLEHAVRQGFVRQSLDSMLAVASDAELLLARLLGECSMQRAHA